MALLAGPLAGPSARTGDVKLSSYPKGRVSVFKSGQWGTLCGHMFWNNQHGAAMVCKQLGYSEGGTWYKAPGGSGPVATGNRLCAGTEKNIFECQLCALGPCDEFGGCDHANDIGVSCKGPTAP